MTDRFAVRTTDRGFGVWDAAVNGWHGKQDLPRDEAVQLAGKMNASVVARQTATGAGSRKVAPARPVLVRVRDTWWPGRLDWWVRESDGWHGRVKLDANGATSWYPSDALRQVGDDEPGEGGSGRTAGGSGSGPSTGTTGSAGTTGPIGGAGPAGEPPNSHGPPLGSGGDGGAAAAAGAALIAWSATGSAPAATAGGDLARLEAGTAARPGGGRGASDQAWGQNRRVGRRSSPVALYRTGDHRLAGRAGGGHDGWGNRLGTTGGTSLRSRLRPVPARPIREHSEVCCPQRVIMSADPCYRTSVRVLRSRARIDRRSRPRSTGMKDAGRNRPR